MNHVRICILSAYCTTTGSYSGMTVVNDGKWHFATLVGDNTSIRIYVDGSSVGEISGAVNTVVSNAAITSSFTGLVDDIFVFNRALTAREVHQLYVDGITSHLALQR